MRISYYSKEESVLFIPQHISCFVFMHAMHVNQVHAVCQVSESWFCCARKVTKLYRKKIYFS